MIEFRVSDEHDKYVRLSVRKFSDGIVSILADRGDIRHPVLSFKTDGTLYLYSNCHGLGFQLDDHGRIELAETL